MTFPCNQPINHENPNPSSFRRCEANPRERGTKQPPRPGPVNTLRAVIYLRSLAWDVRGGHAARMLQDGEKRSRCLLVKNVSGSNEDDSCLNPKACSEGQRPSNTSLYCRNNTHQAWTDDVSLQLLSCYYNFAVCVTALWCGIQHIFDQ